ncbi:MAG: DHHW family protein [Bacillota bacterium]
MKRLDANIILFLGPLFLLTVMNLSNPQRPTVSEIEQRQLQPLPELTAKRLWSGEYFRSFEAYFADTFIFRDRFVALGRLVSSLRGVATQDGAELVVMQGDNGFQGYQDGEDGTGQAAATKPEQPPAAAGVNAPPQESAQGDTQEGLDSKSAILVLGERAMELYRFSAPASQRYADTINRFQAGLPEGVQTYVLLAPIQIEFHSNEKYRALSSPQKEAIQAVYDRLNEGVMPVDAYTPIQQHIDQYLYFRTDHHWTALGAYYAYTAFIQATGNTPVSLDQFEVEQFGGFLGTTYARTLNKRLEKTPDTVFVYKPQVKYQYDIYWTPGQPARSDLFNLANAQSKGKYGLFLGGDVPLGRIRTEVKNGRKIAVIKDSYANAFIPYLVAHYEEVYVIDPRQFTQNIHAFIREESINEVLFLNYILVTSLDGYAPLLEAMMNR